MELKGRAGAVRSEVRAVPLTIPIRRQLARDAAIVAISNAGDLLNDRFYVWLDRWFLVLQIPLGLALYWYGEAAGIHGGGVGLVLWAIPLRLAVVYHVTWLVNSATHAFGYRNFNSPDLSRNCWWVAVLSFGEGWHNNHHAYPDSARHGLRWFEFDITWMHIRLLRRLGLTRKVRQARYSG